MNHRSYWLELTSRGDFRPKAFPESDIHIIRAGGGDVGICSRLWRAVGQGFWTERENWTQAQWCSHLVNAVVSFWVAKKLTEEIGFFELVQDGEKVKIEGFGLLPQWRSRGLGGGLLSAATQHAFDLGATRIWLHTATDDHPNALRNYQKRGYRIYREDALENPMS
jgi:ribosomal protein S18 acetylase RimI-like enzyme